MATRSNINVKVGDVYHTIYCHFDGYPEGVGKTLVLNYNSQELAEKLVSFGDMSSIDDSCDAPAGHSYDKPVKGHCVYYGRDRGETGTDMKVSDKPRYEEEYCYVWEGNGWYVSGYDLDHKLVLDVLDIEVMTDEVGDEDEEPISDGDKVFKYFGCSIEEVIAINNEWAVTFNTPDERMTDAYNERIRWMVRHREAPYQGLDEDGIWHHSFFGRTLYEAVKRGEEYLKRGKDWEAEQHGN
ncbi:hypothetical protein FDG95_gp356 [Pectobacterium phage vB_PcaM_CBB]|uniref:Uncharacterized protein n=1 Tax=Pectobacterium phage vB_PcaM_CBB TaxID=2772511 RepID=A0A1L2CV92_9CAUD|nr:hypothetical protein FDG95_gp356 [Pectobacterium phage vB_PcaM_CBB]AMM43919.1 hypothetical protein CBB_356 [Pectobacterium phage vB_PcaM_CBB]